MKYQFFSLSIAAMLFILAGSLASCKDEDREMQSEQSSSKIGFAVETKNKAFEELRSARTGKSANAPTVTVSKWQEKGKESALYMHTLVEGKIEESRMEKTTASDGFRSSQVATATMYDSFGLFAYIYPASESMDDNKKPNFMYNIEVQSPGWNSGRYWPGAANKLSFYAYAPYNATGVTLSAATIGGAPSMTYITPDAVADQKDLLVAPQVEKEGNFYQNVPLSFKHVLSAIKFKMGTDVPQGKIKRVTLKNVYGKGKYTFGATSWTDFDTQKDFAQTLDVTMAGDAQVTDGETTFMMIPQTLPEDATVEVEIEESPGSPLKTLSANIGGKEWEMGKTITYIISKSSGEGVYDVFEIRWAGHIYDLKDNEEFVNEESKTKGEGWEEEDGTMYIPISSTGVNTVKVNVIPHNDEPSGKPGGGAEKEKEVENRFFVEKRTIYVNSALIVPVENKQFPDDYDIYPGDDPDDPYSADDEENLYDPEKKEPGTYLRCGWKATYSVGIPDGQGGYTWTEYSSEKPSWVVGNDFTNSQPVLKSITFALKDQPFVLESNGQQQVKNTAPKTNWNLSDPESGNRTYNTANTYIVNSPGTYKIPVVYGNGIKNGHPNPSAYTYTRVMGNVTSKEAYLNHFVDGTNKEITTPWITENGQSLKDAKIIWSDAMNNIRNVKLSADKKYITFSVSKEDIQEGNTQIAVKNTEGKTVWSWSIWITSYNPYASGGTTEIVDRANFTNAIATEPVGYIDGIKYHYPERKLRVKLTQTIPAGFLIYNPQQPKIIEITESEKTSTQSELTNGLRQDAALVYPYGLPYPLRDKNTISPYYPSISNDMELLDPQPYNEYTGSINVYSGFSTGAELLALYIENVRAIPDLNKYKIQPFRNQWNNNYHPSTENRNGVYWDNNVVKTVYDPCPPEFCVPEDMIFTNTTIGGTPQDGYKATDDSHLNYAEKTSSYYRFYGKPNKTGNKFKLRLLNSRTGYWLSRSGELIYPGSDNDTNNSFNCLRILLENTRNVTVIPRLPPNPLRFSSGAAGPQYIMPMKEPN